MLRMLLLTLMVYCAQCGQFGSQNSPSIETVEVDTVEVVDFCNMLNSPRDFDGKEVQTTAILVAGFEGTFMYDTRCIDKENSVSFDIESDFANKQLEPYMGIETPEFKATGLDRVRGKFVGTFQVKKGTGFGHMNLSEFKFVIRSADELSFVPTETKFPW